MATANYVVLECGKKDIATKIEPDIADLADQVNIAFSALASKCEDRGWDGVDCEHPDTDFNSMLCCPQNCPLLLKQEIT